MKIEIVTYHPEWINSFQLIKNELETILGELNPRIEHIGSTAVPNLAAKPVIDVAVGIGNIEDLDKTIEPMLRGGYIYYEVYNAVMPLRRLFVGLKDKNHPLTLKKIYMEGDVIPHEQLLSHRLCNVHIWEFGSSEWLRHIAFRDYLIEHPKIRTRYQAIKNALSATDWRDVNEYNNGKDRFIKAEESKAMLWYREKHQDIR